MTADFDVFVCCNGRDRDFARRLAERLRERGFLLRLEEEGNGGGDAEALLAAPAAAVCIGAHRDDPWQSAEAGEALFERQDQGRLVVPVLLPGAPEEPDLELFEFLGDDGWVDLRRGITREGSNRLIWRTLGLKPERGREAHGETAPPDLTDALLDRIGLTAESILRLTAFLSADPIPLALFEEGEEVVRHAAALLQEEIAPDESPLRGFGFGRRAPAPQPVAEAFAALAAASLVAHREGRMFAVHPTVQEALRDLIPEKREVRWIGLSVKLLGELRPLGVAHPLLRRHVEELLPYSEAAGLQRSTSELLRTVASGLADEGRAAEAEPLLRHALDLDAPNDLGTATDLLRLAHLLWRDGRLTEAEELTRRAVGIADMRSPDDPAVVASLRDLALLLLDLNRPIEASRWLRRAVDILERSEGPEAPGLAVALSYLASALLKTDQLDRKGQLTEAEAFEGEKFEEEGEEPDEAEPAAMDRIEEAWRLADRALTIAEVSFGTADSTYALCLQIQARLLRDQGDLDEAEAQMRHVLAILESEGLPHERSIKKVREDLDALLRERGNA